jgi:hypothetical protein
VKNRFQSLLSTQLVPTYHYNEGSDEETIDEFLAILAEADKRGGDGGGDADDDLAYLSPYVPEYFVHHAITPAGGARGGGGGRSGAKPAAAAAAATNTHMGGFHHICTVSATLHDFDVDSSPANLDVARLDEAYGVGLYELKSVDPFSLKAPGFNIHEPEM